MTEAKPLLMFPWKHLNYTDPPVKIKGCPRCSDGPGDLDPRLFQGAKLLESLLYNSFGFRYIFVTFPLQFPPITPTEPWRWGGGDRANAGQDRFHFCQDAD